MTRERFSTIIASLAVAAVVGWLFVWPPVRGWWHEGGFEKALHEQHEEHNPGPPPLSPGKEYAGYTDLITFCDHGHRIYKVPVQGGYVGVAPHDPSCPK